jgi:cytochrome c oxidase assembly protein subunit 15
MMLGVYISASHQGLSCPDWPLCPNGFDLPSEKYFFEHVHRMMVVITASLIFATAAYSARKIKPARKTAIIAAIVVCVQIVFGMLVVTTRPVYRDTALFHGPDDVSDCLQSSKKSLTL